MRSKGKVTINHHAYKLISCLGRPIVTNKQAQKKQQKTQNIWCDLHTLQNMLACSESCSTH